MSVLDKVRNRAFLHDGFLAPQRITEYTGEERCQPRSTSHRRRYSTLGVGVWTLALARALVEVAEVAFAGNAVTRSAMSLEVRPTRYSHCAHG